jgi:succinate dehydrogenase flavin-adding protein (antitoxin of CptAB toxin-antitoxin module)
MKELDVLLERFARRELPGASAEQRQTLTRLLELPDPELVDYLLGQAIPPDPELARLVDRIAIQSTADRANAGGGNADRPAVEHATADCLSTDRAPDGLPDPMADLTPVRHDRASKSRP